MAQRYTQGATAYITKLENIMKMSCYETLAHILFVSAIVFGLTMFIVGTLGITSVITATSAQAGVVTPKPPVIKPPVIVKVPTPPVVKPPTVVPPVVVPPIVTPPVVVPPVITPPIVVPPVVVVPPPVVVPPVVVTPPVVTPPVITPPIVVPPIVTPPVVVTPPITPPVVTTEPAQALSGSDLANKYGNLDPAVVTPPTRDDNQDPRPDTSDLPPVENHGAKMPDGATHKTNTSATNSFDLY